MPSKISKSVIRIPKKRIYPKSIRYKPRTRREGYVRGGHEQKDTGAPGRTPVSRRVIPPMEAGELSKHLPKRLRNIPFFSCPVKVRRRALTKSVKEDGYRVVTSRLIAIQVFTKRTSPKTSKKAIRDRK